jgi:hypothetical protein
MTVAGVALLLHVLAAMAFVSGYVGTNVMTEVARRARTLDERRAALSASGMFDRMLNQRGGTAVIVTAPIVVWAYGYPVTTPWLIISTVMFLAIPASAACTGPASAGGSMRRSGAGTMSRRRCCSTIPGPSLWRASRTFSSWRSLP